MTGEWRRLRNKECSVVVVIIIIIIIIQVIKSNGGACSMYGERRSVYRILVGRPEGRRPLERPRCRREDNIKINLQEVGWGHGLD
jgi:hypothetical protein